MKKTLTWVGPWLAVFVLGVGLMAEAVGAARYDSSIQAKVEQRLSHKKQFADVRSSVEDGIVTLTGTVNLFQQKLDAAKTARKADKVQGVRNLIEVTSNVPDSALEAKLDRGLYFDRTGYGNQFNYVDVSVKNGIATLEGETFDPVGHDSALALVNNTPGVKDVVDNVKVAPVSGFDDSIRLRAMHAIYRDPVLSRYATDPAKPIRIVVDNGHLTLYGAVDSAMDKQVAGIRANQVFGVFSVKNNLEVAGRS